ncbi:hypothetical protein [Deinococcus sp.]|uniref:hypothetical protein n=1 Tax=Deinococcus sp. TaxID=47478 RepID=UPI0025F2251E|nr:hypothetical protein [Deinococcus sp.]
MADSRLVQDITARLQHLVTEKGIVPDPARHFWHSGVYIVMACVLSAHGPYDSLVRTLVRFGERSGLTDHPDLRFSGFLEHMQHYPEEYERLPSKFRLVSLPLTLDANAYERYAVEMIGNSQMIAGRRNLEICAEMTQFLTLRGLQTRADFDCHSDAEADALARLLLSEMRIQGLSPLLCRRLLTVLGPAEYVRPDALLVRLLGRLSERALQLGDPDHRALMTTSVRTVARDLGVGAARLNYALWEYERNRPLERSARLVRD